MFDGEVTKTQIIAKGSGHMDGNVVFDLQGCYYTSMYKLRYLSIFKFGVSWTKSMLHLICVKWKWQNMSCQELWIKDIENDIWVGVSDASYAHWIVCFLVFTAHICYSTSMISFLIQYMYNELITDPHQGNFHTPIPALLALLTFCSWCHNKVCDALCAIVKRVCTKCFMTRWISNLFTMMFTVCDVKYNIWYIDNACLI